ncbi:hypothetical protein [Chakrabartyella piscis]|uniref:hypothetical protein n=1 Tax=Chakrabartyella piscis TaxID=2918914 RepID=UPI0029589CBE|nr:hypothetical protein [Chakrabartyella piscis]
MQTQNRRNSNSRNHNSNRYYSYGSVAYDTDYMYQPRETRKPVPQPKRRPMPQQQVVASPKSSVGLAVFKHIVVIAMLFLGCLMYMGIGVQADNASVQLRIEKDAYSTLKSENNIVEAEITEQLDLDYIRTEAMTRLGMVEPEAYQVVYIDVPKESYTIQYAGEEYFEEEENSVFSLLFSLN